MNPNEILREHFEQKRRQGYSMRALARDLGISATFVGKLFRGSKRVPLSLLPKLAKRLDLDSETLLEIKRQLMPQDFLELQALKTPKTLAKWKVGPLQKASDFRHWYYVAILELIDSSNFDGSLEAISRRLELTLPEVELAVRELMRADLVRETDGRYGKTNRFIRFSSAKSQATIRKIHDQMLKKAQQELLDASEDSFAKRLITGITITANPKKMAIAKKMLNDALYEIASLLSDDQTTQVYHLAAQLFPLTKKP